MNNKLSWVMLSFFALVMTQPVFADASSVPAAPVASAWFLGIDPDTQKADGPLLTAWSQANDTNYVYYKDLPLINSTKVLDENTVPFTPLMDFSASSTPAQFVLGSTDVSHLYAQWSTTDTFVYFGGSFNDGQVLAPAPGWIRAAHTNGAKILGTIFFSPGSFGGDKESDWLNQMVTPNSDGTYPEADQLIKIARAYHFDGYFINEEAQLGDEQLNQKLAAFISYLRKSAPDLTINWYLLDQDPESTFLVDKSGHVVTSNVFLDYSLDTEKWAAYAKSNGYPLKSVQNGVDATSNYHLADQLENLAQSKQDGISLSEYGTQAFVLQNAPTPAQWPNLDQALANINTIWNGDGTQDGLNSGLQEHIVITQTPFRTDFNLGQGNNFFSEGQKISAMAWNSIELTSILPSLHQDANVKYDFTKAYEGGSSLVVTVPANQEVNMVLFNTNFTVLNTDNFTIMSALATGATSAAHDKVCLIYQDGTSSCLAVTSNGNGWVENTMSLASENVTSKIVTKIVLQSDANSVARTYNLGTIYIGPVMPAVGTVGAITIDKDKTGADAKQYYHTYIYWDAVVNATYYDIYGVSSTGQQDFLGRTYNALYDVITAPSQAPYQKFSVVAHGVTTGLKTETKAT